MSALPEGTRCGLHNLPTESGRCERCDLIRGWPFNMLTHDEKRRRAQQLRWAVFAVIVAHPETTPPEFTRLVDAALKERGVCRVGLVHNKAVAQLLRAGQIIRTGPGRYRPHPDVTARWEARKAAAAARDEERATRGPLCL